MNDWLLYLSIISTYCPHTTNDDAINYIQYQYYLCCSFHCIVLHCQIEQLINESIRLFPPVPQLPVHLPTKTSWTTLILQNLILNVLMQKIQQRNIDLVLVTIYTNNMLLDFILFFSLYIFFFYSCSSGIYPHCIITC
jgi:hypothetical protein